MQIDIRYALVFDKQGIIDFFRNNIISGSDSVASHEFICPFGTSAAIGRRQIIIMTCFDEIIGAMRFYPRKKDNTVSIYQFAIDKRFRSRGLMKEILRFSGYNRFEAFCFIESGFNDYYKKEGWEFFKSDSEYNYWRLEMIQGFLS